MCLCLWDHIAGVKPPASVCGLGCPCVVCVGVSVSPLTVEGRARFSATFAPETRAGQQARSKGAAVPGLVFGGRFLPSRVNPRRRALFLLPGVWGK